MGRRTVKKLHQRLFPHHRGGHEVYWSLLADHLKNSNTATIVNIGCGTAKRDSFRWADHKGTNTMIGVDIDKDAAQNPYIDAFILITADELHWNLPDNSADFVCCRSVLEHVSQPDAFFANVQRIMKPEARFLFITPNRWHPLMILSQILPTPVKARLLKRFMNRSEEHTFPTLYRANAGYRLRQYARRYGFSIEMLDIREHQPNTYLWFAVPAYLLAIAYYYLVKSLRLEWWLGITIIGTFRKQRP